MGDEVLRRALYNARIYARLQAMHLRSYVEYPTGFWLGLLATALTDGIWLFFLWSVSLHVTGIGGWNVWELAFLTALNLIPTGLIAVTASGLWRLSFAIHEGSLDQILVRPLSPALQVVAQLFDMRGVGSLLVGVATLVTSSHKLGISWDLKRIGFLTATLASSTTLLLGLWFASQSITFWTVRPESPLMGLLFSLAGFGGLPLQVYDRPLRFVLTWVIPFAAISYYPAVWLLDKRVEPRWLSAGAPLGGPIVALVASGIWRRGLHRYQGRVS
jgi:ABC-2 type transport system permease protein